MMAAVDDNGYGEQQRSCEMTAADGNGMQDWAADYDKEGQEQTVNNDGIDVSRQRV